MGKIDCSKGKEEMVGGQEKKEDKVRRGREGKEIKGEEERGEFGVGKRGKNISKEPDVPGALMLNGLYCL